MDSFPCVALIGFSRDQQCYSAGSKCAACLPLQYTRKDNDADDQELLNFARGISGGASVVRSKYLFDAVNLPQVGWGCRTWAGLSYGALPGQHGILLYLTHAIT